MMIVLAKSARMVTYQNHLQFAVHVESATAIILSMDANAQFVIKATTLKMDDANNVMHQAALYSFKKQIPVLAHCAQKDTDHLMVFAKK